MGHQNLRELKKRLDKAPKPFPAAALKFSCSKASAVSKAQTLAPGGISEA